MLVVYRIFLFFVLLAAFLGIRIWMRQRAIKKVKEMDRSEKQKQYNDILEPCGLSYDVEKDILQSVMYPWQRAFGYCGLYDQCATKLNMILDCEPIYFTYDNKKWMLELWKGQYAFATGAEIGLYVMEREEIELPGVFKGPFFRCATDEERIGMKFSLFRKGKAVIKREGEHWWLTGFVIGRYSTTKELTMEIELTFPNDEMKNALMKALIAMGYGRTGIGVRGTSVIFGFEQPKSVQPKRGKIRTMIRKKSNHAICWWYERHTREFHLAIDKTLFLTYYYPVFTKILLMILKNIRIEKMIRKPQEQIKELMK